MINAFGAAASLATRHEAYIGDVMCRMYGRSAQNSPAPPKQSGHYTPEQVAAARKAVMDLMADGQWRTRAEIIAGADGATTNTVSHFRTVGALEKRRIGLEVSYRLRETPNA